MSLHIFSSSVYVRYHRYTKTLMFLLQRGDILWNMPTSAFAYFVSPWPLACTLEALHTKSVYFIIFNPYDWSKIGWIL